MVQLLGLHASTAGSVGLVPDWGTAHDSQHGQKLKKKFFLIYSFLLLRQETHLVPWQVSGTWGAASSDGLHQFFCPNTCSPLLDWRSHYQVKTRSWRVLYEQIRKSNFLLLFKMDFERRSDITRTLLWLCYPCYAWAVFQVARKSEILQVENN